MITGSFDIKWGRVLYESPSRGLSISLWSISFKTKVLHGGLNHWGSVRPICVRKLSILGSDKVLSPKRREAIVRTSAGKFWSGDKPQWNYLPYFLRIMWGCMCRTDPLKFRWSRGYIYNSPYYHNQMGSINLTQCYIFAWMCAWGGCTIICCRFRIHTPG